MSRKEECDGRAETAETRADDDDLGELLAMLGGNERVGVLRVSHPRRGAVVRGRDSRELVGKA